jgi:hypothetical protein
VSSIELSNICKTTKVEAAETDLYENDDTAYEPPDDVIECIARNEAEAKPEISTEEEPSVYTPLKDNKESENIYKPLQNTGTSADNHIRS